jgi:hypothetical protein
MAEKIGLGLIGPALIGPGRPNPTCRRYRLVRRCARTPGHGRKKDVRPAPFQSLQPLKRGQHRLPVVHVARQAALAKGLTKVASICGEHHLTAIEPQPKRLVPRHPRIFAPFRVGPGVRIPFAPAVSLVRTGLPMW